MRESSYFNSHVSPESKKGKVQIKILPPRLVTQNRSAERPRKQLALSPQFQITEPSVDTKVSPSVLLAKVRKNFLKKKPPQHSLDVTYISPPSRKILNSSIHRKIFTSHATGLRQKRTEESQIFNTFSSEQGNVFPEWLLSRDDFRAAVRPSNNVIDISKVVSIFPAYFRSDAEKEALYNWVYSVSFFSIVPNTIIKEICDRLTRHDFQVRDFVMKKGEIGDCCFIIFQGKAGICLENDIVNSVVVSGDVLGEHALDTEKPRSANVICIEPLIMFRLKKIDYDSILINFKKLEKHEKTKFLMGIQFFESLSFNKNQHISNFLIEKHYHKGDVLFEVGSESNTFYIIKSGSILIQSYVDIYEKNRWPTGVTNWKVREIHKKYLISIVTLRSGMFFGEYGLIHNNERLIRAVCISEVSTLNLTREDFFDVLSLKDIEEIPKFSYIDLPNEQELERRLLKELSNQKTQEEALNNALEINFSCFEGREPTDSKSKRLKKWMVCRKSTGMARAHELKKRIVAENNCIVNLNSVSKLKTYTKLGNPRKSSEK